MRSSSGWRISGSSFHLEYKYEDAGIILESSDDMISKLHSVVLKLASDVFADMLSMLQVLEGTVQTVELVEASDVTSALPDFIYPRRSAPDLQPCSLAATAAAKYGIPDVTNILRVTLLRKDHSLRVASCALEQYAIACGLGWDDVARHISQHIAPLDTQNFAEREILEGLDSKSILNLLALHQHRIAVMSKGLPGIVEVVATLLALIRNSKPLRREIVYRGLSKQSGEGPALTMPGRKVAPAVGIMSSSQGPPRRNRQFNTYSSDGN